MGRSSEAGRDPGAPRATRVPKQKKAPSPADPATSNPAWDYADDPATIGIRDINRPDWGNPVVKHPGVVPVLWGCGVTP